MNIMLIPYNMAHGECIADMETNSSITITINIAKMKTLIQQTKTISVCCTNNI